MTAGQHATPDVFIVMAVFEPDEEFLQAQLASIAAQTVPATGLVVVVADCTSEELVSDLGLVHGLNLDIVVPSARTTSYKSFEIGLKRALEIAGEEAVFALSDQDDVWHPNKLERAVADIAEKASGLTHCDARVIDAPGRILHASLRRLERRSNTARPRGLLVRNSVTGMCSLMTRQVVRAALPFPAQSGVYFHHDLWLALIASCLGGVSHTSEACVDYRQHNHNVIGAVESKPKGPSVGSRKWIEKTVGDYAVAAYLATCLSIRMDEVVATNSGDPDRGALATLAPFLAPMGLGGGFLVDAVLHATGGRIGDMSRALEFALVRVGRRAWSIRQALKVGRLSALAEFDRKLFSRAPGATPAASPHLGASKKSLIASETFLDARTRPRFRAGLAHGKPGQFVVLVPTMNPTEIFAGIATAIDLGLGLAARGHRVGFLATDLPIADEKRTREFLASRLKSDGNATMDRVSLICGVQSDMVEFSCADRFLSTAWWTAHVVDAIQSAVRFEQRQFFYLIQDFEPAFYPWGTEYAGAMASYQLDFVPLFNTVTLRDYFRQNSVFEVPPNALAFRPNIDVDRYARLDRAVGSPRRLALYGRPEVPRNLFPLAVEALEGFLSSCAIAPHEIDLVSVGLAHDDIAFSSGHVLRSLGKIPWDAYPAFLAQVDVGLSLMLSPHPSHPPIEMAASGARVVTNSFSTKDLHDISSAILSVPARAAAIAGALEKAWSASPTTAADRQVDLGNLGISPDTFADRVSAMLGQAQSGTRRVIAAE